MKIIMINNNFFQTNFKNKIITYKIILIIKLMIIIWNKELFNKKTNKIFTLIKLINFNATFKIKI